MIKYIDKLYSKILDNPYLLALLASVVTALMTLSNTWNFEVLPFTSLISVMLVAIFYVLKNKKPFETAFLLKFIITFILVDPTLILSITSSGGIFYFFAHFLQNLVLSISIPYLLLLKLSPPILGVLPPYLIHHFFKPVIPESLTQIAKKSYVILLLMIIFSYPLLRPVVIIYNDIKNANYLRNHSHSNVNNR